LIVSFLIPAFNEARTIAEVIDRVSQLPFEKQLIVIDDGSTDETPAILERLSEGRDDIVVIRQENRGRAPRSAPGSRTFRVRSSCSRTRTWSTTPERCPP